MLDGNPLVDLNNLDRIQAVLTHGKLLRMPELEAMIAAAANAGKSRAHHQN